MAVIASASITLTAITDVASTTRYYKLQSSTLAKPAKPTAKPPSGWTTTEPTYAAVATSSLYTCDLTVFSDGTYAYSDVSLSSSYEAAKDAYNQAIEAAKTASNFIGFSDAGLDVGNKTSGVWSGFRSRMAAGAFQVLDAAGVIVASYGAKLIELGKNATDAVIKLCGGKGEIKTEMIDGSSTLTMSADSVAMRAASADKAAHFLARILNGVPTATMSAYYDGTQSVGVVTATPDGVVMRGGATFYGSTGQYVGDFRVSTVGTASAVGLNRVMVGNDKTKGMDGNAAGALYMYGSGKGFTRIYPSNNTDSNSYLNLSGVAGTGTLPAYKALYSNASGTTGTVTLSETAANFSLLEIFYKTNDGDMSCTRVWAPNGKVANLSSSRITAAAGAGWTKSKQISISGTTLACTGYAGESGIGSNAGGTNYVGSILICYVLGWR